MLDAAFPHVRLATPDDRAGILAMLAEAYRENGAMGVAWPKVEREIDSLLARKTGFILAIDGDGEIAASLGLVVEQWWYSEEWIIGERWNFVRQNYRSSRYALDLIEVGTGISDRWNLAFTMGIVSTIRLKAKIRLYRRMMTMAGAFFIHGSDRCNGPLGLNARDGDIG